MADIFISYARTDYQLARDLGAFLEAEGYSVWYDRDLAAGEEFSDEIARELAVSRAAIVIWTEQSIISKWVRAEAGRAHADQKLIPVKSFGITYDDLPLPFNILHTPDVSSREDILSAVIGQIARPIVSQPSYYLIYKQFRRQMLTLFGVFGTALTIISSIDPLITLSYWTNLLVKNWSYLNTELWSSVFYFYTYKVDPFFANYLSASLCILSITFGSLLRSRENPQAGMTVVPKRIFQLNNRLVYLISLLFLTLFAPQISETSENAYTILFVFVGAYCVAMIVKAALDVVEYLCTQHKLPTGNLPMMIISGILISVFIVVGAVIVFFVGILFGPIMLCSRFSQQDYIKSRLYYAFGLVIAVVVLNYAYIYVSELKPLLRAA